MIMTSTNTVCNCEIGQYLGIVSAMGMYLAGSQITGGMTTSQDEMYEKCLNSVIEKITEKANSLGADAIVGINVKYISKDSTNDMVISMDGTAVRFKNTKEWSKIQKKEAQQAQQLNISQGTSDIAASSDKAAENTPEVESPQTEFDNKASNFATICERIKDMLDLSPLQYEILLAFEEFQVYKKIADVQKNVTLTDSRLEIVRVVSELEKMGIIKEDQMYYMVDDTIIHQG